MPHEIGAICGGAWRSKHSQPFAAGAGAPFSHGAWAVKGGQGSSVDHDIALLGGMFGIGEGIQRTAGQDIDQLDAWLADQLAAGRAGDDSDLERQPGLHGAG